MNDNDIRNSIVKVIARIMKVAPDSINDESSPDTILIWDSGRHIDLVISLEEEFDITFDEQQIIDMMNVGLVVEVIKEIKGKA